MSKKIFALVAGLLLATGFDVWADLRKSPLKDLEPTETMTNGGEYFLTMYNGVTYDEDGVLTVQGDSLAMVDYDVFDSYSRSRQDSSLWVVNWTNETADGSLVYTFTNKSTGKNLSLPKEEGKALVDAPDGFSQYLWVGYPTTSGSERKYTKGGILESYICADTSIQVCKTFVLTKDITAEAGKLSYNALKSLSGDDAVGYESIRLVKVTGGVPSFTGIQKSASATDEEIAKYKKVVAVWDSLLAIYGMSRETAGLESYKKVADVVDGLSSENRDARGFDSQDVSNAIDQFENVINYSCWGSCGKDYATGVWRGTLLCYPNKETLKAGEKYAAGTVLVACRDWVMAAQYKRGELADDGRYFGEDNNGTTIDKPENDPTYIKKFANAFREGEQPDSSVVLTLDFTKGDAPTATNNLLKGKKIQLVRKNLLFDGTISNLAHPNNLSDFRWAQMIYDPEADKYLYVSNDTYDESAQSTNFVLKWVSLKDLSGCLTGTGENAPKAGVSYNNVCDEDGNVLPHAGSAIFRILYNRSDSSVTLLPYRLYIKKDEASAADTTGSSTYYNYTDYYLNPKVLPDFVLGLKKFGSDVVLTVVNTKTDKVYPIHKGTSEDKNYTKATTESDIYLIRYVSEEDKENNGKYYTHEGLKMGLTEFELMNNPENQWMLLTDEASGLSSIHNRETNLVFTDLKGKKYENVQLYEGADLKAGDIIVTTIGGDTLRLSLALDATSRSKSTLGYFVPSAYNEVMEYEFNYYNGLDDTKKLNVDNDSLLFVDPTGGSAKFKLIVGNLQGYGAPGIPGKTASLQRYTYNLATTVNGDTCVVVEKGGKYAVAKKGTATAVDFLLKEMTDTGYALIEANRNCKASVNDESLRLSKEPLTENRTSIFSMPYSRFDVYRRFGKTIEDCITWNDTAYIRIFKANEPNRYLYENSKNVVAGIEPDGLGYLGMYNKNDMERNASIFVDPVCVTDSVIMYTYMMAVDVTAMADTLSGRYLVSLSDSTVRKAATYNGYTRLAFVDAKHVGGSLIIAKDTIKLTEDLSKATFALELTDRVENNAYADFYIKSSEGYLWINNGVPVLTDNKKKAAVFNARKTEVVPTANESISAEGIKVIAGEGFVVVKGAEGKKVVVTNVLGQKVASMVASSNDAQITAPAGVVVVLVEGEPAVKTIVK